MALSQEQLVNKPVGWGLMIVGMAKIMTRAWTPCHIMTNHYAVATEVFCVTMFYGFIVVGAWRIIPMSRATFLVGSIPLLVSLLAFFFGSSLALTLFTQWLICGMTNLEEGDYFINCNLVVFFLLLDKLVSMFSRKGVKENQVTFLFTNGLFIISLEVVIQL